MLAYLHEIYIPDRIREDIKGNDEDWKRFVHSFEIHGQLQPVTVEEYPALDGDSNVNVIGSWRYRLVAGHRRFLAITELNNSQKLVKGLGALQILVNVTFVSPERNRLLKEFAENNDRKDFNVWEKAKFIRKFHEAMLAETTGKWTQELTAEMLNLSTASISYYLNIEQAAKTDQSVAKATTLGAAVKRMKVTATIKGRLEAAKNEAPDSIERAHGILAHGDARNWVTSIGSESIDLVNFDGPWGDDISYKAQENHEGFDDSKEYAIQVRDALLPEIFRILKQDRFCIFWYPNWYPEEAIKATLAVGFNVQFTRTPCNWYKPDKVVDQNRDPERKLVDTYETFFLLRKGNPIFHERHAGNTFTHNRVPSSQVIHPTEKPISLCVELIKLCSVPGEKFVDPCAGSSAFLEAAKRINRKPTGCELSETYYGRGISRLANYLKTFKEGTV